MNGDGEVGTFSVLAELLRHHSRQYCRQWQIVFLVSDPLVYDLMELCHVRDNSDDDSEDEVILNIRAREEKRKKNLEDYTTL